MVLLLPFAETPNPVAVGYIDDQVKPPKLVVDDIIDVPPCTAVEDPNDNVVDVVLDAVRVVLEVRVVVVVDDTVVASAPVPEDGSSKPASRAHAAESSPSRQQKPGTGAHHVPASQ